jgi:peptidoglycan/LPS O-acetylase OafA/YrhL
MAGARRGRPVLGFFGGLLLGLGGALFIQQAGLWPLDPALVYGLPGALAVLGALWGRLAPLGGRR